MYEKKPDFACELCHKSFKNQRALDAHNDAKHPPDFIIFDEASEVTPEAWEKL